MNNYSLPELPAALKKKKIFNRQNLITAIGISEEHVALVRLWMQHEYETGVCVGTENGQDELRAEFRRLLCVADKDHSHSSGESQ